MKDYWMIALGQVRVYYIDGKNRLHHWEAENYLTDKIGFTQQEAWDYLNLLEEYRKNNDYTA